MQFYAALFMVKERIRSFSREIFGFNSHNSFIDHSLCFYDKHSAMADVTVFAFFFGMLLA